MSKQRVKKGNTKQGTKLVPKASSLHKGNAEQGAKLLEQAVSFNKPKMIKFLEKYKHSADIEAIESIDTIKAACFTALNNSRLTYGRQFLDTLQKNYTFSEKISKDLAALITITSKFSSVNDLLSSREWADLGRLPAVVIKHEPTDLGDSSEEGGKGEMGAAASGFASSSSQIPEAVKISTNATIEDLIAQVRSNSKDFTTAKISDYTWGYDDNLRFFGQALNANTNLTTLDLADPKFDLKAYEHFLNGFTGSPSIQSINIGETNLEHEFERLIAAAERSPNLVNVESTLGAHNKLQELQAVCEAHKIPSVPVTGTVGSSYDPAGLGGSHEEAGKNEVIQPYGTAASGSALSNPQIPGGATIPSTGAEIKVAEFLYHVVSLEKAQMIQSLTDEKNSKDVDAIEHFKAIQSFNIIKDVYSIALKKGFVYAKKFVAALQQNYTFNPTVSKDLAALVKMTSKFKTAGELLSSREWESLGQETVIQYDPSGLGGSSEFYGAAGFASPTLKIPGATTTSTSTVSSTYDPSGLHDSYKEVQKKTEVTILEKALSLDKAAMIDFLAANKHSPEVQSESIHAIKDAYSIALKKGFVYAKKFVAALQQNYIFNPTVSKDLTALAKMTSKFKTAGELLSSPEWQSLGGAPIAFQIDDKAEAFEPSEATDHHNESTSSNPQILGKITDGHDSDHG